MRDENSGSVDQAQIRGLIESCARAIATKDPDAVAAHYTTDLVAFDMMPPLRLDMRGYKQNYAQWFADIEGQIDYEIGELKIVANGDTGFCTMINRVRYTMKSGEKNDGRVRITLGLRKIGGKWLAAHEHISVPFDMSSGKALMNLTRKRPGRAYPHCGTRTAAVVLARLYAIGSAAAARPARRPPPQSALGRLDPRIELPVAGQRRERKAEGQQPLAASEHGCHGVTHGGGSWSCLAVISSAAGAHQYVG